MYSSCLAQFLLSDIPVYSKEADKEGKLCDSFKLFPFKLLQKYVFVQLVLYEEIKENKKQRHLQRKQNLYQTEKSSLHIF